MSKLSVEDSLILSYYSSGHSYQHIQKLLREQNGIDLEDRKLGYRMDRIKDKMECKTQFQMGYKYNQMLTDDLFENMRFKHTEQLRHSKLDAFDQGKLVGKNQAAMIYKQHDIRKGIFIGVGLGIALGVAITSFITTL
jgi:hypothetical protein